MYPMGGGGPPGPPLRAPGSLREPGIRMGAPVMLPMGSFDPLSLVDYSPELHQQQQQTQPQQSGNAK